MINRDLSAGQLRYHVQELSVSVARRLVAVLDAARNAPHGVAGELDAIVSEITDVQRDLAYEMAGPPLGGAADLSSLTRMLELQQRMMALLDRLETISSRPITSFLEQRQRTGDDRVDWTAPPAAASSSQRYDLPQPHDAHGAVAGRWEQSHHAAAQAYEDLRRHTAFDSHGAGAAPFVAGALGANAGLGGASMARWAHMSPAARWGLLPMAICIVSALLTTAATQLMQGDTAAIVERADGVAKRGDRLDTQAQFAERAAAPLEQRDRIALAPDTARAQVITVSPPVPQSDRGLDALNPDAPSVAVLATYQDPAVARQTFLTMQERYPAILGAMEAEIEAVQTEDGVTWHRLSIVPPVPRSEAKDLCKRLRAAGYAGCWVKSRPE